MVFSVAMGFHLYAFHHADTSRQTGTLAIVLYNQLELTIKLMDIMPQCICMMKSIATNENHGHTENHKITNLICFNFQFSLTFQ